MIQHTVLWEKKVTKCLQVLWPAQWHRMRVMKQRDTQGKGYGRKTSDKKKFSRPATLKAGHNFDRDD